MHDTWLEARVVQYTTHRTSDGWVVGSNPTKPRRSIRGPPLAPPLYFGMALLAGGVRGEVGAWVKLFYFAS